MKRRFGLFPAPLHDSTCLSTKTRFRGLGSNISSSRPAPLVFLSALIHFFLWGCDGVAWVWSAPTGPFVSSFGGVLHKRGLAWLCYVVVQVFSPRFFFSLFFFFFHPGATRVPEEANSDCWWPNGNGGLEERGIWSPSTPAHPHPSTPTLPHPTVKGGSRVGPTWHDCPPSASGAPVSDTNHALSLLPSSPAKLSAKERQREKGERRLFLSGARFRHSADKEIH